MASIGVKVATLGLAVMCAAATVPRAQMLVTPEEAARPDGTPPAVRGLFPGPEQRLVFPVAASLSRPLHPPFRFKVAFEPRNGAAVDLSKVSVQYVKVPSVDLTSRMSSAISGSGIDLQAMMLPPGQHTLLVSVMDTNGDRRVKTYTLVVGR